MSDDKSQKECLMFLKKASDVGFMGAIGMYASVLETGDGVPVDHQKAAMLMKIAANNNDSDAMCNYAITLSEKKTENNSDNDEMGKIQEKEIETTTSKEESIQYYKMAIEKGNARAMFNYANMLSAGDGCQMNKEEVMKYYKMAIEKGISKAMYNYALMLQIGDGCQINTEEAIKYFKIAIELGYTESMYKYACMLRDGDGISINTEEAIKYFKIAIELGDTYSMIAYAYML